MRNLKTYLSVAPVVSTLWFGSLAGLLIEINRLFPENNKGPENKLKKTDREV